MCCQNKPAHCHHLGVQGEMVLQGLIRKGQLKIGCLLVGPDGDQITQFSGLMASELPLLLVDKVLLAVVGHIRA